MAAVAGWTCGKPTARALGLCTGTRVAIPCKGGQLIRGGSTDGVHHVGALTTGGALVVLFGGDSAGSWSPMVT